MTYKENMSWLLGNTSTRAAEEKKNNTDTAKWMSQRSEAEGKFYQKLSAQAATLIGTAHKQWKEGQQAQATEDYYLRSVEWDPNSVEAQTLQNIEEGGKLQNIQNQKAGVEARKNSVDGNLVNFYTGKSPAYLATVARLKLDGIAKGYKGWMASELLNDDTELTIPNADPDKAVKFKVNETTGLPDPTARNLAHKYLRQKFFQQHGLGNFSEGFLNHTGFFKSIVASDAEMGAKWRKESDIAHSAQQRHLKSKEMGVNFNALTVHEYITTAANGVDEEGNFISYEKSWDMFEDWIINASGNYDISQRQLTELGNSKVPDDPKGRTYAQKWPSRFGPEGTLAQKLHKARKDASVRDDQKDELDEKDSIRDGIAQLEKIPEGEDELLGRTYIQLRADMAGKGYDTTKLEKYYEGRQGTLKAAELAVIEIEQKWEAGTEIDFSSYDWRVQGDPRVKKIKEAYNSYRKKPAYKTHEDSINSFLNGEMTNAGWKFKAEGGFTASTEAIQYYNNLLRSEEYQGNYKGAAYATRMWLKENGYKNKEMNAAASDEDKGRFWYDSNNNSFPNLVEESDREYKVIKSAKKDKAYMDEMVRVVGGGSVEDTINSDAFTPEPGASKLPLGAPPLEEWDIAKHQAENNGAYPPWVVNGANALDIPARDFALARQGVNFPDRPLDPQYQSQQSQTLDEAGLSLKDKSDLFKHTTSASRLLQIGENLRNGIMEARGVDAAEANRIFLDELAAPYDIGTRFAHEPNYEKDPTAANLGLVWLADMQAMSDTAFMDLQEGAEFDIADMYHQKLGEGVDPYDLLGTPFAQLHMAMVTGELKYLLREENYRKLKKQIEAELEEKEAAELISN